MSKPTGFLEIDRESHSCAPVAERLKSHREFTVPLSDEALSRQGARCMDCGTPFCHRGCPLDNIIPDWNDLVYRGRWREALEVLHSTNNFPEFTGRVCPAPCEAACTLNIIDIPVAIKDIEQAIVDKGWEEGWIAPRKPTRGTGKKVAVVGSGPAGLACAQQLARAGHAVTVFEKSDRIGGLLRYGIPDFKLDKRLIDRRMAQMEAEGVTFRAGCHIGAGLPALKLLEDFDAVALAGGAEAPRDLAVPGRGLGGVHFAMPFLVQSNRRNAGDEIPEAEAIDAGGKRVVVIGGGDTGSDCIGTANRQGALGVTQIEILPRPPEREDKALTWPEWPEKHRVSSSQKEGCVQEWSVATKSFEGKDGRVVALNAVRVEWEENANGGMAMKEIEGGDFRIEADLVLLAMGFVHPVREGMVKELGLGLDRNGNVDADAGDYRASLGKVFAAGDMRRGQSLVVWAIREGRQCARSIDEYLMGESDLAR